MKAGEQRSPQTTGQDAPDGKATGKGHETTGQSPKAEAPDKAGAMDKDKSGAPSGKSDIRSKPEQNGAASKSTQSTTEQSRSTTTGQGAAAGSAKLSTEQRTKITSIIREHKVEPTKLSVSVSIGTRVPASVHLYPLPVQVVEVIRRGEALSTSWLAIRSSSSTRGHMKSWRSSSVISTQPL
jgi:hypothetical protein